MTEDVTKASAGERELWSAEAAVMARPFVTYRALGEGRGERTWRDVLRGLALQAVLLGAFVSLTTAGRLVAAHVIWTAVFWAFLPILQMGAVATAVYAAAPKERIVPALSLYLCGMGPYYVFYLVIAGVCLLAPDVYRAMTALLRAGPIPIFLVGTIVWGMVITWAFFREGMGMSRAKGVTAMFVFYGIFVGVILSWYLVLNQIQPQVTGTGG